MTWSRPWRRRRDRTSTPSCRCLCDCWNPPSVESVTCPVGEPRWLPCCTNCFLCFNLLVNTNIILQKSLCVYLDLRNPIRALSSSMKLQVKQTLEMLHNPRLTAPPACLTCGGVRWTPRGASADWNWRNADVWKTLKKSILLLTYMKAVWIKHLWSCLVWGHFFHWHVNDDLWFRGQRSKLFFSLGLSRICLMF